MSLRPRAICPECREEVRARRRGDQLEVCEHPMTSPRGLVVIDPVTLRRRPCRGVGRLVEHATLPHPRPVSYEETARLIDALLGEAV